MRKALVVGEQKWWTEVVLVLHNRCSDAVLVCARSLRFGFDAPSCGLLIVVVHQYAPGLRGYSCARSSFELDPVSFHSTRTVSRAGDLTSMPQRVPLCCHPECSTQCNLAGGYRIMERQLDGGTDAERWRDSAAPSYDPKAKRSSLMCGHHSSVVINTYIGVPFFS